MNRDDVLKSTRPVLYETDSDEFPYAYAGTCFPIKFRNKLYIVSAKHCFENHCIKPEKTLYPRPNDPKAFLAFYMEPRVDDPNATDKKHADQTVLRVASSNHTNKEIAKACALDLASTRNAKPLASKEIVDIRLRGFPFDNPEHFVDYDKCSLSQQAYSTNCCISKRKACFCHCYYIKMKQPSPKGMSPNGMSGTPVYGVEKSGRPVYCGMIIEFNKANEEYLIVGPEALVNTLREL